MTTEREWIEAARRGDERAFEELVRTYENKVYHLALRMCNNREDAMEIAQEAFLSAWRGLPFFREESSFATWLYRLTTNAAIDFLRRDKRTVTGPSLDDEETFTQVPDTAPSPHRRAEQRELREALAAGLATLTPEHRQVLLLRELPGMRYEEIAQALDLDIGTVKSRIARAREKLRKYLVEQGNFLEYLPSNVTGREG